MGAHQTATAGGESIRERVPAAVLRDFESMIRRGRKGIVVAVNGVCSGCHLRVSTGTASALGRPDELGRCDNCGRYLYLLPAPSEPGRSPGSGPRGRSRLPAGNAVEEAL